ncbi:MAG: SRPBCC family protein [Kofleriaceae bacterium]|nr:SRPBCC family protein [Kofleriaceae bacterium]
MPEVEYATTMPLGRPQIWEFVKDMNNWAPFVTGYQGHEIIDDTDSIWTLKGDVGILSRTVKLRAHITEWIDQERVTFTLTGLNEKVDGGGVLVMTDDAPATGDDGADADAAPAPTRRRRWFGRRFLDWLFRRMFRRMHGEAPKRLTGPIGAVRSRLSFTLRMDAGGPTGPLVNAMLAPALEPAAEELANKIAAHLERVHLGGDAGAADDAAAA